MSPRPVDLNLDPDLSRFMELIAWLRAETDMLEVVVPPAIDAQWTSAPVPKPREDTTERAKGGHGDPVPGHALCERRVTVRGAVLRSEGEMRRMVATVRGARLALERALHEWEGTTST